ncbi:bifunctional 5,10-methylenetetrahydrofolate dehydrogenase/5,10-methenyltetrahydrofolate cyclohydrolase [Fructilactobacillus fructivorans]|uniref:Bifunctional protein FolD n=1 Tax=Fructilactobacillus fructivorans TaxID=1614 RepID=A0AAE6TWS8_9LACO|nr:tetrahydrofolate dehydrogenase/cyclohydrolase catalytic domain-containing protein [Fructilactobacillus fructivorans]KRK58585.1 bifunctional 5,10-methylene-tetrahydrofolate dehydrogenase 5,10-methylene-tetrahydrofolate cyclohydrolase [Fructilactobacillus fructivorans]KRN13491.1 bifunctional 5,10-methylene-tetrahydrofolate dehydrogenase 5,10-methylene-tetrahydrofolate cyclohydrolase [Fructilactobacillus fructivorans]KRN40138.1 bifunctional 5,10-methylene-tetrahydrofolate dehydrogenase 5,10-meth
MVQLINGKRVANDLNLETKKRVICLKKQDVTPGLAVVIVGDDPASQRYVRSKEKKAKELGIFSIKRALPESVTQSELVQIVKDLNHDDRINGILVQSPLPDHIDEEQIIATIDPKKDVDGFHPVNVGKLFLNLKGHYPVACTPKGIMTLLAKYKINLDGKNVVVVGRSSIVGKPMLALMLNADATVIDVHSHTDDISKYTKHADIVISAVGKYAILNDDDFKPGAVVIDVGQNMDENGKLAGDVAYKAKSDNIEFITPVPGGVGPMTIATLMQQTVDMCEWSKKIGK